MAGDKLTTFAMCPPVAPFEMVQNAPFRTIASPSRLRLPFLRSLSPSLPSADPAASADFLRGRILSFQAAVSAIEHCRKPVIAAIHGACVGGGVDLAAACDIRCCSDDAFFEVKEVDLALAADLGSLQRLPHIIGYGNAVNISLTGRRVSAVEAKAMGLISTVFSSPVALEVGVDRLAKGLIFIKKEPPGPSQSLHRPLAIPVI
ncbi:Peroxisomal fatty acid beta-oxidation multifunctional protein AIM1 [Platanthera guangdongensis]|uniref:Peroxisomal fatty acid beta-oxidation multifunctional protein AIM1 n=1 Tax=Platanthera guangdongensis TaxID=2320717 RepID=A0ABR2MU76_9ASPA